MGGNRGALKQDCPIEISLMKCFFLALFSAYEQGTFENVDIETKELHASFY